MKHGSESAGSTSPILRSVFHPCFIRGSDLFAVCEDLDRTVVQRHREMQHGVAPCTSRCLCGSIQKNETPRLWPRPASLELCGRPFPCGGGLGGGLRLAS